MTSGRQAERGVGRGRSTVTLHVGTGAAATYTVASSKVMTTAEAVSAVAGAPGVS